MNRDTTAAISIATIFHTTLNDDTAAASATSDDDSWGFIHINYLWLPDYTLPDDTLPDDTLPNDTLPNHALPDDPALYDASALLYSHPALYDNPFSGCDGDIGGIS